MSGQAKLPPRVASWPHWYGPNPYLPLLYGSLAESGIDHVANLPPDPALFTGKDRRADFLHLHWAYPLWRDGPSSPWRRERRAREALARLQCIRQAGVPLIWTVHNLEPHDGLRWGEKGHYQALHAMADLRIFHSSAAMGAAHLRYGTGPGESLVVPHGNFEGAFPPPSSDRQAIRSREGLPIEKRVLLCFGQVRRYKGFDLAVRALRHLDPQAHHLVVAGRSVDSSAARLNQLARGRGNLRLVLSEIGPQLLADLLEAADGVLLPYREVTTSGVLLHALTAGRGVIASDHLYFREVIQHEPNAGVLVSSRSPELWAGGIRRFFDEDPDTRRDAALRLAAMFRWPTLVGPLAQWILGRHQGR